MKAEISPVQPSVSDGLSRHWPRSPATFAYLHVFLENWRKCDLLTSRVTRALLSGDGGSYLRRRWERFSPSRWLSASVRAISWRYLCRKNLFWQTCPLDLSCWLLSYVLSCVFLYPQGVRLVELGDLYFDVSLLLWCCSLVWLTQQGLCSAYVPMLMVAFPLVTRLLLAKEFKHRGDLSLLVCSP